MPASLPTLVFLLEQIGAVLDRKQGKNYWYYSPFRKEKTASFHVDASRNIWYDFGAASGGGILNFVEAYLKSQGEDHTPFDVDRWIKNMGTPDNSPAYLPKISEPTCSALKEEYEEDLSHPVLLKYLSARQIRHDLGKKYFKQVRTRNRKTGRSFFAIAFRNMDGGLELRNEKFKGCIAPKTITFKRGTITSGDDVHIFEGGFDFVSALHHERGNRLKGDSIILNSNSNLAMALRFIKPHTYKNIYTWFDNDASGQQATDAIAAFARQERLKHISKNDTYGEYKDVNAWHVSVSASMESLDDND